MVGHVTGNGTCHSLGHVSPHIHHSLRSKQMCLCHQWHPLRSYIEYTHMWNIQTAWHKYSMVLTHILRRQVPDCRHPLHYFQQMPQPTGPIIHRMLKCKPPYINSYITKKITNFIWKECQLSTLLLTQRNSAVKNVKLFKNFTKSS